MDQVKWLKQTEGSFSLAGDHASVLAGKLEDLLFRAQRIARALRSDSKAPAPDLARDRKHRSVCAKEHVPAIAP